MKLHEAIALRKGEVGRNKARLTEVLKGFKKPAIFAGFVKTYDNLVEDGEILPGESKRVQRNVEDDLKTVKESLGTLWGTVASVERGNCDARGDIVVNGETILSDVPVTTLLFLETQLTDLRTTAEAIPTLSPDFEWVRDENDGLFKTPVVQTHRNKKATKAIVKYDATEHHPAQTDLITVDELAGYWNTVQHSGAMQSVRKAVIVGRIEQMLDAVKAARARANASEAPKFDTSAILNFIFA